VLLLRAELTAPRWGDAGEDRFLRRVHTARQPSA